MFAYGNRINYDSTLVDLTSNFFILCTYMKIWRMELSMNIHEGKG